MTIPPTIVKLGGSHAFSLRLVEAVAGATAAAAPVVIVPGGGPFADAVREAQPRIGFTDTAAHHMAILAMCQYGEALASLHSRLKPANTLAAVQATLARHTIPVWTPWPLADGLDALPASWDITSDSLAAWLGNRLNATRLILVKSTEPPASTSPVAAETLARDGIVDPAFPAFVRNANFSAWWIGPSAFCHLTCMIDGACEYGARIAINADTTKETAAHP